MAAIGSDPRREFVINSLAEALSPLDQKVQASPPPSVSTWFSECSNKPLCVESGEDKDHTIGKPGVASRSEVLCPDPRGSRSPDTSQRGAAFDSHSSTRIILADSAGCRSCRALRVTQKHCAASEDRVLDIPKSRLRRLNRAPPLAAIRLHEFHYSSQP